MSNSQFISNAEQYLDQPKLEQRLDSILDSLQAEYDLSVTEQLAASDYYGTGKVGAVLYLVEFKGQKAVLKVQGVKPEQSEPDIIEQFQQQNQSQLIRPPQVLLSVPWDEKRQYAAFVMEYISGDLVMAPSQLHKSSEISHFFDLYQEYRRKCINQPWLEKPAETDSAQLLATKYQRLQQVAPDVKPHSPYRQEQDPDLIAASLKQLQAFYQGIEPQFQHGHFSLHDLLAVADQANSGTGSNSQLSGRSPDQGRQTSGPSSIVLLSNLFWRWTWPYQDAVFAYHWFIYSLATVPEITPSKVEQQRQLWLKQIYQLAENEQQQQLITAALLERAIAGLLIDAVAYIDQEFSIAQHLVDSTRQQVQTLSQKLPA
jgi:hypothetical protein